MSTAKTGRRPADRRVQIDDPRSPYFRTTGEPGVVVARPRAFVPASGLGRFAASLRHLAFGRPLRTAEEGTERLSKVKALAVFSSDNLSSVAYATEAILFTLVAAGTSSFGLALPISLLIVAVLSIIVVSYRQTIRAYPNGGGSYVVARENLGAGVSLVAGAALLTDYVLTVAVSVAAGVAAITSAFPGALDGWRVEIAAVGILLVMLVNLRGVRESGTIFAIPTYVFVGSMLALIAIGLVRTLVGAAPVVTGVEVVHVPAETLGVLLLMRAFADGCTAITGVEAVSNGVPAFRRPEAANARITLTVMAALVGTMFIGTTVLAGIAGAVPAEGETILSQLGRATFGGVGPAYYVLQFATMGILILAANTAFADFPRLASLLARDGYMPSRFAFRGERLAFSTGIVALAVTAIAVVAAFGGRVEALIPLYAVGVFSSITLSQAGMVRHWLRERSPGWTRSIAVNGFGAVVTAIVAIIFAVAKFAQGAWLILIVIPAIVVAMVVIHRRYEIRRVATAVRYEAVIGPPHRSQRVIVPVADVTRDVVHALTFARTMSQDVTAVHVTEDAARGLELRERFERQLPGVPLVIVESPYRSLVAPLMRYLEEAVDAADEEVVIVLLPQYVPRNAFERFLFGDNGRRIRERLLGRPNVLIAEVPYRRPG
jgi:amino acid transporter